MAYTTINKSSLHINTNLYTGTGSNQNITGTGFAADLIWLKERSHSDYHFLCDNVRGKGSNGHYYNLSSNATGAESNQTTGINTIGSDGFSITARGEMNENGHTYASWNWKANGSGSSNTAGGINSTVSVNTTSGFSIIKYTGNGSNGSSVGHGLGVVPQVLITKRRNSADEWIVQHYKSTTGNPWDDTYCVLNTTAARSGQKSVSGGYTPNANEFYVGNDTVVNGSGSSYVTYAFVGKTGYSKFNSYTGNGNADGTFVYTGFKPAWIMIKRTDAANQWIMLNNKMSLYNNNTGDELYADSNAAQNSFTDGGADFLSNGFKLRGTNASVNGNNMNYIFMAFGQSIVGTNNVPATAR